MMRLRQVLLLGMLLWPFTSSALLTIEITQGVDSGIPIATLISDAVCALKNPIPPRQYTRREETVIIAKKKVFLLCVASMILSMLIWINPLIIPVISIFFLIMGLVSVI